MRVMASSVLALESVVLMLVTIPMITLYDVAWTTAVPVCLGLGVVAIATCGLLRSRIGIVSGSLVQVAAVALGFVVPVMFVLGVVFGALWVAAVVLGRQVDAAKAARGE
ncbi:MAG: DUF4233 domain-containing protein [Propionibacteriales bacterium]|nr:DUF4233 domain-containing protein [Propionibacteriales bacterium]